MFIFIIIQKVVQYHIITVMFVLMYFNQKIDISHNRYLFLSKNSWS